MLVVGFLTCNGSGIFCGPKLVSIGRLDTELISCLHWTPHIFFSGFSTSSITTLPHFSCVLWDPPALARVPPWSAYTSHLYCCSSCMVFLFWQLPVLAMSSMHTHSRCPRVTL